MGKPGTGEDVTVIIPHIPIRGDRLRRAVESIRAQTMQPRAVIIMTDDHREGSAAMRNKALPQVETEFVAFLDDDDEWMPNHLEVLTKWSHYDVVYPGCRILDAQGREIPRRMEWGRFLQPFDAELLRETSYIPVTSLVRTHLAQMAQFGAPDGSVYDDWGFYLRLLDLGASFVHVPEITWFWWHHSHNTQGLPSKW